MSLSYRSRCWTEDRDCRVFNAPYLCTTSLNRQPTQMKVQNLHTIVNAHKTKTVSRTSSHNDTHTDTHTVRLSETLYRWYCRRSIQKTKSISEHHWVQCRNSRWYPSSESEIVLRFAVDNCDCVLGGSFFILCESENRNQQRAAWYTICYFDRFAISKLFLSSANNAHL